MSQAIKSILETRGDVILNTGVNPISDLQNFARDAEIRRQDDNLREYRASQDSKFIDVSEPLVNEASEIPTGMPQDPPHQDEDDLGLLIRHDWKLDVGVEENSWIMSEGRMFFMGQGDDLIVPETTLEGAFGSVFIRVSRDQASRAVSDATPMLDPGGTPPSDAFFQYFEVGTVGGDEEEIIQKEFHPIRVLEELRVFNGEFKLINTRILGDNAYDIPPP